LSKRLQQTEAQLVLLQRSNDEAQAQIFELTTKRDAERAALQSEIDILSQEVERRIAAESELKVTESSLDHHYKMKFTLLMTNKTI
jgi:hypothetical protein